MRVNKTEKNLKLVVKQLDNASGDVYNALDTLARMKGLSPEMDRLVQEFDVSPIDALKQRVEQLLEEKQEEKGE